MKHFPPGEPVPGETYRADGWRYVDTKWYPAKDWDAIMTLYKHRVVVLARTQKGDMIRGQLLISPEVAEGGS